MYEAKVEAIQSKVQAGAFKQVHADRDIALYLGQNRGERLMVMQTLSSIAKSRIAQPVAGGVFRASGVQLLNSDAGWHCFSVGDAALRPLRPEELHDPATAALWGEYLRRLHQSGQNLSGLCDLPELLAPLTPNNILKLWALYPAKARIWQQYLANLPALMTLVRATPKTLCNASLAPGALFIAEDKSRLVAMNLGGIASGMPAMDVANACAGLGRQALQAFTRAYGPIDRRQQALAGCLGPLLQLINRAQQPDAAKLPVQQFITPKAMDCLHEIV